MPKVPVYQPTVQTVTPSIPDAPVAKMPAEAFGTGVQEANARLGEQIQKTGQVFAAHAIEMQQKEDEATNLKTQLAFQTELQNTLNSTETDENGKTKGLLQRNFASAKGSTLEFDQIAPQLKQKYMQTAVGPEMQRDLDKALSIHLSTARDQVSKNEANQLDADFKATTDDAVKSAVQQAALLDDPVHLSEHIALAQDNTAKALKHLGYSDARIQFANQNLAGDAVKASVMANLEKDPVKASALFESTKAMIPGTIQTELQKAIDGKIIHEQEMSVWQQVQQRRLSNGMIDLAAADKIINSMPVPAERRQQISASIRSLASVADTELKQRREANDRDFTNALIQGQAKGLPYQDALRLAAKSGYDSTDIADKQHTVTELYTEKTNAFDTWIKKQPEATQASWAYVEESIKGKYGNSQASVPGYPNKVNLAAAALTELKQDALGKSPDQIRKLVNDKLKDVVVKPGWLWDTKDTGWKADAGLRQGLSEATSMLEKDYGAERVSQARLYLTRHNIPITPRNIKATLDKALNPVKS